VPSIGLAAGARIPQASALPPAPAPGGKTADALRFNRARAHIPGTQHDSPGARARTHGASTVRGHIYLAQSTTVLVVVRARRTSHRWATCFIIRWTKKKKQNFAAMSNREAGAAAGRGGAGAAADAPVTPGASG